MSGSRSASVLLLALLTGLADPNLATAQESGATWQAFELSELLERRSASGRAYLSFLDEATMRAGIYHLGAGADDHQSPHGDDEIYWVASGAGSMTVAGESTEVAAGDVIFVRAGVDHRFHSITEDLDLVVVFVEGPPSDDAPAWARFTEQGMAAERDAEGNAWNPFLRIPTMIAGLYMLPEPLGGDGTLVHPFDEFNIVTAGSGSFTMATDTIDIGPGTLIYVDRETGHNFHGLQRDLDVIILWENPR